MSVDFSPYRALVVEDNDFVRLTIVKHLKMFGFEKIDEASEGFAAINLVNENKPDIIICDIGMEPVDGFDFLRHLRRLDKPFCSIPVIFLTGHSEKEYVEKARDLEVDAYLLKPVLPQDLYIKIRKFIDIKP